MDEEHTDYSPKLPLFLQWQSAARRWNSWTNIRDLFLPEWGEKQQSISIFIFSHSFYLPQVCILYTWLRLCLVQWWVYCFLFFVFFSSCIMRSYLKGVQALCDLFHMYEKFKKKKTTKKNQLYVCISIPLVVFFSNHKITLYTCIVWLYWNYVDIDRGVI